MTNLSNSHIVTILVIATLALAAVMAFLTTTASAQSARPVVNIFTEHDVVTEGEVDSITFTAEATAPVSQDTRVYITVKETGNYIAYHETDYFDYYWSEVIPAGETTAVFTIPIHDDLKAEADGYILVDLQNGLRQNPMYPGQYEGWSIDSDIPSEYVKVQDDDSAGPHPTASIYAGRYSGSSSNCTTPESSDQKEIAEGRDAYFTIVVEPQPESYLMLEADVQQDGDYIYTPSWYTYLSNEGEQAIYITPYDFYNACMDGDSLIVEYYVPTIPDGVDGADGSITVSLKAKGSIEDSEYFGGSHYVVDPANSQATVAVRDRDD